MDDPGTTAINSLWILGGVSFVVSLLASLLEGALQEFSWARIEERIREEERRAALHEELPDWDRLTTSVMALNALANVSIVICTVLLYMEREGAALPGGAVLYALIVALSLTIYLGDLVPYRLGSTAAETIVLAFRPLLGVLVFLMSPFTLLASGTTWVLVRIFGIEQPDAHEHPIRDDILSAVEEGKREGVLQAGGAEMIEGVMQLKDVQVGQIMTPRTEMVSAPLDEGMEGAIAKAAETGHSRLPIYDGTRDNIVGILYVRDLVQYLGRPAAEIPPLNKELLYKPFFVPETKKVAELLKEFKRDKIHFAVVLDEYGGTAGVVTIEDILEEIVGDIAQEFQEGEESPLRRIDATTAELDARVHIDELNEAMGLDLPDGSDYDTVGGFLFASFGKVPAAGEIYTYRDAHFTVLEADDRKINRVKVQIARD